MYSIMSGVFAYIYNGICLHLRRITELYIAPTARIGTNACASVPACACRRRSTCATS